MAAWPPPQGSGHQIGMVMRPSQLDRRGRVAILTSQEWPRMLGVAATG
jgi:hypothetical protein